LISGKKKHAVRPIVRIIERPNTIYRRRKLLEQFQPFHDDRILIKREAGGVATGSRQTWDEPTADRIADLNEHNRYRLSCLFQPLQGGRGRGDDNIWIRADELHRIGAQALGIAAAPANIDPYIAAIIPSELLKAVSQGRHPALRVGIALQWRYQHADPPHPLGLLRACGERPGYRRAAKCS
jgi:hypothetical protein